jgi:hypothetical protein
MALLWFGPNNIGWNEKKTGQLWGLEEEESQYLPSSLPSPLTIEVDTKKPFGKKKTMP